MEEAELGCSVCQERYNDTRSPRNLGCGHSVCTSCIEEIINRNRKCPECRRPFYAHTAASLPVNYPLLRLSRALTAMNLQQRQQQTTAVPSTSAQRTGHRDAGECAAHLSRMQNRCMTCNVWVCQECLEMDHVVPPTGNCEILPVDQALEEMKKVHLENISTMYQTLQELKNEIGDQVSHLEDKKRLHDNAVSKIRPILQAEVDMIHRIDNKKKAAVDKLSEVENWVESLKEAETGILQAHTVRQLATAKFAARDRMTDLEESVQQERERHAQSRDGVPEFTWENLTGALQLSTALYVVRETEERRLWSRISLHDCILHLHVLQESPPPASALVFSTYESVREMVPADSPSAFFDLKWDDHIQGRVYMTMYGDTPRGRQFLHLCSGERGPSYRGTGFFDVDRVDEEGEIIRGGDYEHNDGKGGAGLVEELTNGGVYYRDAVAGLVVGAHTSQTVRLGVFGILLSDYPYSKTDTGFGRVTSGLGTLRSAARHMPTSEAVIDNCGLVIPL